MSNSITVSPAYGRDYKSKAAALADWNDGKDFIIETFGPAMGKPVSRTTAEGMGLSVSIRYDKLRKVVIV